MNETWIAPAIMGAFSIVVAVVGAIMARRGARLGNREQKAPDVQELWVQQEMDRRMRRVVEDLWYNLRRAFQSYFRRVNDMIAKFVRAGILTEQQAKHFELTTSEQKAIDTMPPSE